MKVEHFFDKDTFTLTYVVYDSATKDAVVIDPVLDYEPESGQIRTISLEKLEAFFSKNSLDVKYILETHAHADHISSAQLIKKRYPYAKIAIGEKITEVQRIFSELFNFDAEFPTNGSQFDHLLKNGETLTAGSLSFKVIATPGHTPACVSYLCGEHLFVGDALFMPDYGTGRCDFPGGSAENLYQSVAEKIYLLPEHTKIYTGHDYQPNGRALKYQSTVKEEKEQNIQLTAKTSKEDFLKFRSERDKTLKTPKLLLPSIQINITGGHLPAPEPNGKRYLKIPLSTDF